MNTPRFDRFYKQSELSAALNEIASHYENLVSIESMGKSYECRDILVATITNIETGPAIDKPAIWFDGNIHATELTSATACLYLIYRLASQYGTDDYLTHLLDTRTFYVCPRVNPDGAELALADHPRFIRSSTKPYPSDLEPSAGIEEKDIDGDGRILFMRIPDTNGNWKKHSKEPKVMIRREPTESTGEFYTILHEGELLGSDADSLFHAPRMEGLDLNRNFGGDWAPEGKQSGAGAAPLSEPETRAMTDFIVQHKNICIAVAGHTYGGVLLRSFTGSPDEDMPVDDLRAYKVMGNKGEELTSYPALSIYHDFRYHPKESIRGHFDAFYQKHGIFSWTVEYWSPLRHAGIEVEDSLEWAREHPPADDVLMVHWFNEVTNGKAYVDWYDFDHPQLGMIELGGWDLLTTISNPPKHLIEKEIAPVCEWVCWLAGLTPKLQLHRTYTEPLGERLFAVKLVVENRGYFPTNVTEIAVENANTPEVLAEISLPSGAEIVRGDTPQKLGHLTGRSNVAASMSAIRVGESLLGTKARQRTTAEWIVRARPDTRIKLSAYQCRSGRVDTDVVCE